MLIKQFYSLFQVNYCYFKIINLQIYQKLQTALMLLLDYSLSQWLVVHNFPLLLLKQMIQGNENIFIVNLIHNFGQFNVGLCQFIEYCFKMQLQIKTIQKHFFFLYI
ncbi:unnamed protein product [Paramecium pentaurelia]|uniref:Uncharacterized protein n=1 Tax=Paramecium pentaurelia TaxID=43138 RepID=A0A8S1YKV3_9CILI|nr:unnamed protein product [Paramecium pentaurelia]